MLFWDTVYWIIFGVNMSLVLRTRATILQGDKESPTERPSDFTVSPGVETVTVLDAEPLTPMTLYNADDEPMVTHFG